MPCVYSVCGEMYTQNSPVYNCPSTLSPESDSYESDSFSPQFNTSPQYSQTAPNQPKLPRIPPLAVLQQRRLAANARERKRANKINFAFNRLRKVLPGFEDREISKYEAIQLAQDYIKQLVEALETNGENKENHNDLGTLLGKPEFENNKQQISMITKQHTDLRKENEAFSLSLLNGSSSQP